MTVVTTRIRVAADGSVSLVTPLPEGEHMASLTLTLSPPIKRFSVKDLPTHNLPWDDSVSLRREDMYGDDGR